MTYGRARKVDRGAAAWRCTELSPFPPGLKCSDDTPAHSTRGTEGAHATVGSGPDGCVRILSVRHGTVAAGLRAAAVL